MKPIGVGVLGCGRIAQTAHLPALEKAESARLVAVADPATQLSRAIGKKYSVSAYRDVDALVADPAVEAVIIAVPDRLHLATASRALEARKHVLVEKPLASTLADAIALQGLVDRSGMLLQVGAMRRQDPGIRFAAAAIAARLGRIHTMSTWYRVMLALRPPTEGTLFPNIVIDAEVRRLEDAYKSDREVYLLATHGSHVFDTMRFLVGDLSDVSARVARQDGNFSWHGTASLLGGGLTSFEITAGVHGDWSEGSDIYGELGHVRIRTDFPFFRRASEVQVFDEAQRTCVRPVFGAANAWELQIAAFASAIQSGTPTDPDAADGVAAMAIIEAVQASASLGGAIVSPLGLSHPSPPPMPLGGGPKAAGEM